MYKKTTTRQADLEQAGKFLSLLFSDTVDLKEIRLLPSGQQFFDHDLANILTFIGNHLDENVCFGVATRKTNDGSKNGVSYVTSLWADIDWKDFPGGQAEADEAIRKFPLKPSIIVSSGHGYHLYWLLREPVSASIEIEGYLKGMAKALGADPAAAEISHLMRIPGTYNYKNKDNVVAAELIHVTDRRYSISDFKQWKIVTHHQHGNTKVEFTESTVDVDIRKFGLSTKIIDLINGEWQQYGYKSRSEADQAVVTALIAKGATPDEVKAIFHSYPVGQKYRGKGSAGDAYLKHSIQSAQNHIGATNPKDSDLPEIDASSGDLPAMASKAWSALIKANDPPGLFEYGGKLVRIEETDEKQAIIQILTQDRLHYELARVAVWYKWTRWGKAQTLPPMAVVRDMLARPDPPLPPLTRIVEAPMFGKDSKLIITPGYHPGAQVYYSQQVNFAVPRIPEKPTAQEIEDARNIILDILRDFPFAALHERANAIAIMFLPFVRDLIDGQTPLHLIEKPSPGTGASLLADILIYPSLGRPLPVLTEGGEDAEWRKKITALMIEGAPVIFIDNIQKRLESPALAAAITAPVWKDRLLNRNETVQIPVRCVWIATGNNPVCPRK